MEIFWFIPSHGDGRYLGTTEGSRQPSLAYLSQVVRAIDDLGYHGALLPTGRECEDAWVVASSLISQTSRMKFLVAVRPGLSSPTLAARMAATFDRLSKGRLLINVVTGGDMAEMAGDGLHLSHDDRYELTDEFLTIWRGLCRGDEVTFAGKYLNVTKSKLHFRPVQQPYPPLYFGGSSEAAVRIAAQHVDMFLTWGEPPKLVAEKIEAVRSQAAAAGRTLRFGIRLHVIVRETDRAAWAAADDLISRVSDDVIAAAQKKLAGFDSVSQQRMLQLQTRRSEFADSRAQPVGRRRPGAARCGNGPRRRSGRGGRTDAGIRRTRHRHVHPVGHSPPRRGVPRRRPALPEASVGEAGLCRGGRGGHHGDQRAGRPRVGRRRQWPDQNGRERGALTLPRSTRILRLAANSLSDWQHLRNHHDALALESGSVRELVRPCFLR